MISPHPHDDDMYFGIYLCTSGHCRMTVNDAICNLKAGDAMVKSPLVRITAMQADEHFECTPIFEDDIQAIAPIAATHPNFALEFLRQNKFCSPCTPDEQATLLNKKKQIDHHKARLSTLVVGTPLHTLTRRIIELMEQTTLLEYAGIFLSSHTEPLQCHNDLSTMTRFVFMLFSDHTHHRQVNHYARALCLSPNHFTRLIKRMSGRTPSEWIALVTINQAKKFLRTPDTPIKEVAARLGFPEQFTFRKYFKQHTGLSPSQYRAQHT